MMNDTMTSPPQTTPELVRLRSDRMVAGVASGLARRFDIGTGWVRLGFVVSSFFGGLGVLLYVIGWLVIRDETESNSLAERWIGDLEGATAWVGVGLIVLAAMVVLGATNIVSGDLVFAAGLFVAGVLLYRGKLPASRGPQRDQEALSADSPDSPNSLPGDPDPLPGTAGVAADTVAAARDTRPSAVAPAPGGPPPLPPSPPRPGSYLGRFTVAATLILVGVIAILDNLGVVDPAPRHYIAGAILMVGGGLLIGSLFGRARGLIALGLVAIPVLLVAAAVRVPFGGEWGDQSFSPTAVEELQAEYQLSGGSLRLDLSDLEGLSDGVGLSADVGVGELVVFVPTDAAFDVSVTADVGIGELDLDGDRRGGLGIDDGLAIGDESRPTLYLDLEVGIGSLRVITTP